MIHNVVVLSRGWTELAARSHYSFLEGSSSPAELVATAAALEMPALGLCDRNGLYGAVEFIQAARAAGIHPVIGAELDLAGDDRLRLLALDRDGYRHLSRAISAAQLAGEKGHPLLDLWGDAGAPAAAASPERKAKPTPPERPTALRPTAGPFPAGWPDLPSTRELPAGPPAHVDPADLGGCFALAGGPESTITRALLAGDVRRAERDLQRLRKAFGAANLGLLLTHHLHPADTWLCAETAELGRRCGVQLVASNLPVHATPGSKPLLDVLTAIRHRTTLDNAAAHGLLLPNAQHRLKSEVELRELLQGHDDAFVNAAHLAARCDVALDFSDVRFPGFPVPQGETPFSVLYKLCHDAVPRRYQPVTREVAARLQRELDVIEKTGLAEFFLITWDIMRYAREQHIPGQGRGSAADSIVAYLLGITRVDPVEHNLLFERFLHEEHTGTPDIDIDFSTDHREQVLQYVYDKYGSERTGMVANVVTYRPRMAIRQVGAAMGFPENVVDRLAKSVNGWYEGTVDDALDVAGLDPARHRRALPWEQFKDILHAIERTPRHLGIHVGGMLVTGRPLVDVAPVERATMPGRVVVQFDKDDVEDLGLIKMDLLGLRTLSVIHECLQLVEQTTGTRPDLDALPLDDARVYDMICAPDTIGLFQIESRAQLQALYQSQPRVFNDLIIQVAIIRPGPIQGNAVHPFLRRRRGLEEVTYAHPALEPILAETRGVILYQEQILRIVMEVAGYSAGEADRFRRAMNRHRSRIEMQALHDEFVERCGQHGLDGDTAEQIFNAAAGFAQFGFCKSHAAAFARTAYETAWLKLEHPAHWLCGLLNAQPMGFYHPSVLVEDGKRHGVRTLPVDVTRSDARCRLEWIAETAPPVPAVRNGLAPGWRIADNPDGTPGAVRDGEPRPTTPGESAAERAVHAACRDIADPTQQRQRAGDRRPPSPALGGAPSPWAVRLGFNYVRALGPVGRDACAEAVRSGATASVADFWRATRLPRPAMENLVMLGGFDAVAPQRTRRELLWELREAEDSLPPRSRGSRHASDATPPLQHTTLGDIRSDDASSDDADSDDTELLYDVVDRLAQVRAQLQRIPTPPRGRGLSRRRKPLPESVQPTLMVIPAPSPELPDLDDRERVDVEYRLSELSTGPHLLAFLRHRLDALGCIPLARVTDLPDKSRVRVAGLVIVRQAPSSASGFRFFTLADEGGHLDLVLRPRVYQRVRSVANFHPLLLVEGVLEVEAGRLNVLVEQVQALDGNGNVIATADARFGRRAATAPKQQHGHITPPADDTTLPPSHDFR